MGNTTYQNTENLKVVDMCRIFDEEFPDKENRDDSKLFKYLYLIIYSITLKERKGWFRSYEDYDKYAFFAASTLYMRFIKQQGEGKQIKSVRNYFRASMAHLKDSYQKQEFAEVITPAHDDFNISQMVCNTQNSLSNDYFGNEKREEVESLLRSIPEKMWEVVKESPYNGDDILCHRLYVSSMLTFLNGITPTNQNLKIYDKLCEKKPKMEEEAYFQMMSKEQAKPPILWKLEDTYSDYVKLIVNKMKLNVVRGIKDIKDYYTIPEDVVTKIMSSPYSVSTSNGNGEDFD